MNEGGLRQEIRDALFDVDKLCTTRACVESLKRYRSMFPNRVARERSKRSVFFQKFFGSLHADAMICYLEKSRGWPMDATQEHLARLEVDTLVNIAIASNWNHVVQFYSDWFDRLETEFEKTILPQQENSTIADVGQQAALNPPQAKG